MTKLQKYILASFSLAVLGWYVQKWMDQGR